MSLQAFFNRLGNPILSAMLRSPLHGMLDGGTMLVSVTGRRSGRVYSTPVNFLRDGETLTIISLRERTWWRNLRGGAAVELRVQGKDLKARAEAIENEATVAEGLKLFLQLVPGWARYYQVKLDPDGRPNMADLADAAKIRVIVRTRPA